MLRYQRGLAVLLLAAMAGACATRPQQSAGVTFVVVRHAEKADDGSKDPPLTEAGHARSKAIDASLSEAPLRAVYATAYRRTQSTAAPTALRHSLPVITYDAKIPADEFATQLRRDHTDGTVLVVAHSNTSPGIAAALCQCAVQPMSEAEYDRRMAIHIDADGRATLQVGRY